MRRAEKDRLPARKLKNRRAYWQRYLVGDDKLIGFDVMALSDDYQQLMEDQLPGPGAPARRPAPRPRRRDGQLRRAPPASRRRRCRPRSRSPTSSPRPCRRRARKLVSRFPVLREPGRFDLLALDLELNRFLPVRRFLDGEIGRFADLADADREPAPRERRSRSTRPTPRACTASSAASAITPTHDAG